MMTIWLNAQSFCILWLLIPLTSAPHGSRAGGRSQPDQGRVGHAGGLRGTRPFPDNDEMNLLCQMVLRRDRDLNSLHHQNTYILFLSTGPDSLVPQLLQASAQWKQQKESNQVNQSLKQCLMLTLLQRANKVKESKMEDALWTSSLQSKLILQDASWPFLKWDHSKKVLDLDGKTPASWFKLWSNSTRCWREPSIVRFHALQNKTKQAPVIPWRLELDMKDLRLHTLLTSLVHNSVWQLIQVRLKPHHQKQSKPADELMKLTKKKLTAADYARLFATSTWWMMTCNALSMQSILRSCGCIWCAVTSIWGAEDWSQQLFLPQWWMALTHLLAFAAILC